MGIYIPGIEMPIAGMSIEIAENVDGKVYARLGYGLDDWHEVISVPEHGRLVDADALMGRIEHDTPLSSTFEKIVRRYIEDAPTVVPASEEGET